jgi:hypothetical protein
VANTVRSFRQGAVGFIDWLDDTGAKSAFDEIMGLCNEAKLLGREVVATKSLHIFQCIEELKLLIRVRERSRISGQQIAERTKRATLTPAVDQCIECLEQIEIHRARNVI